MAVIFEQLASWGIPNNTTANYDKIRENTTVLTDLQSISLCTDSDEHVFETCYSLSGQGHSFILDTASRQPLKFRGIATLPLFNGHGDAVHIYFLVQKRDFTLLGVRAMHKLGISISCWKVKEEPKHPKPVPPSTHNCDIEQDSAKIIPHAYSLSRHDVMIPPCKTSHKVLMQPLLVSR